MTYRVMTGLLRSSLGKYIARREEQAGKERADLVYEPAIKGAAHLILIEFKHDCSADEAITRIKMKNTSSDIRGNTKILSLTATIAARQMITDALSKNRHKLKIALAINSFKPAFRLSDQS